MKSFLGVQFGFWRENSNISLFFSMKIQLSLIWIMKFSYLCIHCYLETATNYANLDHQFQNDLLASSLVIFYLACFNPSFGQVSGECTNSRCIECRGGKKCSNWVQKFNFQKKDCEFEFLVPKIMN